MKHSKRAAIAVMCGMLAMQSVPLAGDVSAADGDILVTDFEDGDVSAFAKRGDNDTSVIAASTEDAHSGTTSMAITERSEGWNGPSLALESVGCEPGVSYIASAWVKTAWYNNCMLSMQYTDEEGEQHYNNLASVTSNGDWVEIPATKFSFSDDMQDVQIYIECSDSVDLYVDDFSLISAPVIPIEQDIPGLKDVYADYFKIGGAVTAAELAPNSTKDLIRKHYNSLTLGNELKPENMLDQAATVAYMEETGDNTQPVVKLNGQARAILNFCRDNDIPVRGHVLVWHSQTPGWFFKEDYTSDGEWVDKETMTKRMEAYIKGVFEVLETEYSDVDFYAWDVVNEAWLDDGKPRNPGVYDGGTSNSGWTAVWGDNSFIELAFEYARKYAPEGCKLYYNDYNEYMPQKTDVIIEMAESLKAKGLIDGIGMQSHLDVRSGSDAFPSASMYEAALAKFVATGLDIQITELDATISSSDEAGFKAQAQYYSDIMDAAVKYADSISAVVFWGTTDDQSWRASQTPLLFNADYTAKPAFYSIIDGIDYKEPAQTTTTSKTTAENTTTTTIATTTVNNPPADTSIIRGDVNCDKSVDVADAVLLARYLAQDPTAAISDQGQLNAEIDGEAGLTGKDVATLLQAIARIITLD